MREHAEAIPAEILRILPVPFGRKIAGLPQAVAADLEEIRIAVGRPVAIRGGAGEYVLTGDGIPVPDEADMEHLLRAITESSFHSWESQIADGYITIRGGHRVGLCGKTDLRQGKVLSMQDISSVNIRRTKEILGASEAILPRCFRNGKLLSTLIVSPPKKGKTTLLRDMIRWLSTHGQWVGLADERSEIAGMERGRCRFDLGPRCDVVDGCSKSSAMIRLIRTMGPDVIATDEIGTEEDRKAIEVAILSGVKVLATLHGDSVDDAFHSRVRSCIRTGGFQRLVLLDDVPRVGAVREITDEEGEVLYRPAREEPS